MPKSRLLSPRSWIDVNISTSQRLFFLAKSQPRYKGRLQVYKKVTLFFIKFSTNCIEINPSWAYQWWLHSNSNASIFFCLGTHHRPTCPSFTWVVKKRRPLNCWVIFTLFSKRTVFIVTRTSRKAEMRNSSPLITCSGVLLSKNKYKTSDIPWSLSQTERSTIFTSEG